MSRKALRAADMVGVADVRRVARWRAEVDLGIASAKADRCARELEAARGLLEADQAGWDRAIGLARFDPGLVRQHAHSVMRSEGRVRKSRNARVESRAVLEARRLGYSEASALLDLAETEASRAATAARRHREEKALAALADRVSFRTVCP